MSMTLNQNINLILAAWNPIGVTDGISLNEYESYVPLIYKVLNENKKEKLMQCLTNILKDKIGLPVDSNNSQHIDDLNNIVEVLLDLYKKYN